MAGLSIWHVIIFLIVVVLLFGTSKLKNLGKDMGGAVKDFKKTMQDDDQPEQLPATTPRTVKAESNVTQNSKTG
ncbi:Sec-independent protein translocase subunit TatA [Acinetobacter sp. B5B]|uniref:Sec-independent protein translocase subunit TatA n=1 Tax=Acinetobacter baretiae TaxID=2605383 RepID=UPI0018C31D71|nr:Sec-independent protein translocase subunit TatA [Acinetobacter baretiae]MBF7683291.1 Sec-independent protein translocase subunit TatA [Acinetobacter baretiae]MBF7684483.1 Sec-independent protein translocase subunit TatA [Acinetobacter baretiae]